VVFGAPGVYVCHRFADKAQRISLSLCSKVAYLDIPALVLLGELLSTLYRLSE